MMTFATESLRLGYFRCMRSHCAEYFGRRSAWRAAAIAADTAATAEATADITAAAIAAMAATAVMAIAVSASAWGMAGTEATATGPIATRATTGRITSIAPIADLASASDTVGTE